MDEIIIDVWGDFACFSRPEAKVERLTYPVPTHSALRGLLSAIYSKPNEFYWQIRSVEVLSAPKYVSFKRNEVKNVAVFNNKGEIKALPIQVDETGSGAKGRTQRQTTALKDVRYRVHASIIKRPEFKGTLAQLYNQAERRIQKGQCYYQPCMGLREFPAYFEEAKGEVQPIDLTMDLGYMIYDTFDLHKYQVEKKTTPFITMFHAMLNDGILHFPDFDSTDVLKPEDR